MKIVRILFERLEDKKEIHYSLCGDICDDKKMLKKKINEIIEEVYNR